MTIIRFVHATACLLQFVKLHCGIVKCDTLWLMYNLIMRSIADGHLGCFQHGVINMLYTSFSACIYTCLWGFLSGSDSKESACNAGDPGSVPELERPPGKGNVYPLQYLCLENSMEPSRLQSMESQRVGHEWVTNTPLYLWVVCYILLERLGHGVCECSALVNTASFPKLY